MLDIISVGPGEAVLLTDDAKQAIDRADAVWCAARHAVLVPPEKARPLSPLEGAIEQMRLSSDAGQSAAVLVSGDAGLYSLLEMLKRKIGGEYLRVHPGVSALQLFAARLGVSWQDAKILSAHGRALSESALCHARSPANPMAVAAWPQAPKACEVVCPMHVFVVFSFIMRTIIRDGKAFFERLPV